MTNPVIDRAMRAAFEAWRTEMVRTGEISVLNARFDDIAPKDRRLIELQCRAAIASLKEPSKGMQRAGYTLCVGLDNMDEIFSVMIDAALKDD